MRSKGKGKSRLNGKGVGTFTMGLSDEDYDNIYFGGKGNGKKVEEIPGDSDPLEKGLGARPTLKDVTATL